MKFGYLYKFSIHLLFFAKIILESISNSWNNIGVYKRKRAKLPDNLDGKTVVITGANSGIGVFTAKVFAQLGAKVWMLCRDVDKAKNVLQQITKELNDKTKSDNLLLEPLDLSSLKSVRKCASRINSQTTKIDYLINNAGVMMCPETKTEDGFELQFATNHLGHFLLTNLLMDKIKASQSSRIINLSSIAHLRGEMHFDNINLDGIYTPLKAYGQSKLANVLFTVELAKRLRTSKNVQVFSVHPGLVDTSLWTRHSTCIGKFMSFFHRLIFINAELGAQTTLFCAFDESIENQSGQYFSNCQNERLLPHAMDEESAKQLWQISAEFCNIENNNLENGPK